MCADTGFGFILYGVKKAQFAKLPELILQGIRKTFDYYGIRNEITDDYLSGTPELFIGADRKETARLNRLSIDVSNYFYYEQPSELMDLSFVRRINHRIVGTANNDTFIPLECMLEGLETRYNIKPVCRPAFTMTAAMDFGAFETRRKLTIPVEYTITICMSFLLERIALLVRKMNLTVNRCLLLMPCFPNICKRVTLSLIVMISETVGRFLFMLTHCKPILTEHTRYAPNVLEQHRRKMWAV